MEFEIQSGGENQPDRFIISQADGSAYYLTPPGEDHGPGIVQVPLDREGVPLFEAHDPEGGFYGGGEVDFDLAFGPEEGEARERVKAIREALVADQQPA